VNASAESEGELTMSCISTRWSTAGFCLAVALTCLAPRLGSAETRFITDAQGRVVVAIHDDGTRVIYTYGADGSVTQTHQSDGARTDLSKDAQKAVQSNVNATH